MCRSSFNLNKKKCYYYYYYYLLLLLYDKYITNKHVMWASLLCIYIQTFLDIFPCQQALREEIQKFMFSFSVFIEFLYPLFLYPSRRRSEARCLIFRERKYIQDISFHFRLKSILRRITVRWRNGKFHFENTIWSLSDRC